MAHMRCTVVVALGHSSSCVAAVLRSTLQLPTNAVCTPLSPAYPCIHQSCSQAAHLESLQLQLRAVHVPLESERGDLQ